jgi:ligand-binding SRPBCC domain-containing protein
MSPRTRPQRVRVLERTQFVPVPVDRAFAFFSDARNLERITPPWLSFRVMTEGEIRMGAGVEIDYRIRIAGIPARWRSLISRWEPGVSFVDEQLVGPYRWWHHTHTFSPHDGGARITDRIEYAVSGWILEPAIHALFVRKRLEGIFEYRREQIGRIFADGEATAPVSAGAAQS